jgi:hypothetical protein
MRTVKTIQVDRRLDAELEKVMPPHFRGRSKTRLRIEHLMHERIEAARKSATLVPEGAK